MKPKSPEAVKEAALARQNGQANHLQVRPVNPNGALMQTLYRVWSESREVESALKAYSEAAGLSGSWILRVTAAEMAPNENSA